MIQFNIYEAGIVCVTIIVSKCTHWYQIMQPPLPKLKMMGYTVTQLPAGLCTYQGLPQFHQQMYKIPQE